MAEQYKGHKIKIVGKKGAYQAIIFPPGSKGATKGTPVMGSFRTMGTARQMARMKIND